MAAVVESVDALVANRMRRSLTRHANYGDWVAELSEPMFRQLVREGLYRTVVHYFSRVALMWLMLHWLPIWTGTRPGDMYLYAFTTILTVGTIASSRKQSAQCFERECIYRRQHGKWRWER